MTEQIPILTSPLLNTAGFPNHGFTTKKNFIGPDGNTHLIELKSQIGTQFPLARTIQVHGNRIVNSADDDVCAMDWTRTPSIEADGIVSSPDCPALLAIQTADCVPVLLASAETGQVAAVHAGWRGLKSGVIRNAVNRLKQQRASAYALWAVIGPCICETCYEVDTPVARHFPESATPIKGKSGKYLLNLGLAAEVSLLGCGLTSSRIHNLNICTSCNDTHPLFSYRKSNGSCGRQLSFIVG